MNDVMTEGLQATPYLVACYGIAAALMVGFAIWNILQAKKLETLRQALDYREKES